MQNGDLDGLIMRFEQLVHHANYDINQPLVLCIFTDALPHAMCEYIFKNIQPRDYEGWQGGVNTTTEGVRTHEESTRAIQPKEECT
jgi:hypothetical protein